MTPAERRIRLEVGAEILQGAILDFLKENRDSYFSTKQVSDELEFNYYLCHDTLQRLEGQEQVVDERTNPGGHRRWRYRE